MWDSAEAEVTDLMHDFDRLTLYYHHLNQCCAMIDHIDNHEAYTQHEKYLYKKNVLMRSTTKKLTLESQLHEITPMHEQLLLDELRVIAERVAELQVMKRDLIDYQPLQPGFQNVRNRTLLPAGRKMRQRALHEPNYTP